MRLLSKLVYCLMGTLNIDTDALSTLCADIARMSTNADKH